MDALTRAIAIIGGQNIVAQRLGLKSAMAVSQWKKRGVPAEHILKLCNMTDWSITPHELAPALYPHPSDGIPEHRRNKMNTESMTTFD
ncbi:MAG: helix-turn-helix domain-containing protein [Gammaproteobacteria bacterium]|nr:helix-turn-helix domain-containing protein [Gammaproteobacteria bacterium]